jgi:hypothetical protein
MVSYYKELCMYQNINSSHKSMSIIRKMHFTALVYLCLTSWHGYHIDTLNKVKTVKLLLCFTN